MYRYNNNPVAKDSNGDVLRVKLESNRNDLHKEADSVFSSKI